MTPAKGPRDASTAKAAGLMLAFMRCLHHDAASIGNAVLTTAPPLPIGGKVLLRCCRHGWLPENQRLAACRILSSDSG